MNLRELPGYEERLTAIREDISKFTLGQRLLPKIMLGFSFGRMDCHVRTDIEMFGRETIDSLVPLIFGNLLPSTRELGKALLETFPTSHDEMMKWMDKEEKLRASLLEDVRPLLVPIAENILERNRRFIQQGRLSQHNRDVALEALKEPLLQALNTGVSLEDISALVAELQKG